MEEMKRCPANYPPLTPICFIERASTVFGDCTSIVYNNTRFTWSQTFHRCRKLASALSSHNISHGDVVSVVAPNIPAMYEMHFAVPMAGAVLNTVNTRLNARTMSTQFAHCEPKFIFADYQYLPLVMEAINMAPRTKNPSIVLIEDPETLKQGKEEDFLTYETLISQGDPDYQTQFPKDEWDSIVLNYTSGTTSAPKGAVHSHRGVYAMGMDTLVQYSLRHGVVYLWTLPMFHANGWCFAWATAAIGATNICLRRFDAKTIFESIADHKVTHLCGAPVVLSMIANAPSSSIRPLPNKVEILTGGAPPPASILFKMEELGFSVMHGYGLTETSGTVISCAWKPKWDDLKSTERAKLKARQGIRSLSAFQVDVKDPVTMNSVARDGIQLGEIMIRAASVMKGYLKNEELTARAFAGGWFRTGDVAVVHPDGYLEIKDRSKDVIISGGENISSVEVESVLYSHPLIAEAAVVGIPDPFWGETPCAFVSLKNGHGDGQGKGKGKGKKIELSASEIILFCRERMAHFMAPKSVVFLPELPKTSTGKIQKFVLREKARNDLPSPVARL